MSRAVTHVEDITVDPDYALPLATTAGYRSVLGVPMLRESAPIGAIIVARGYMAPFSNNQIKLLKTFADQAVIAIENTRLFEAEQASKRELQESLEYQTATAKVLSVISSSPNDLQPVIDVIVEIAHDLCEADYTLFRKLENGGFYRVAASKNADPAFLDWLQAHPVVAGDGSTVGLVAAEKRTIHQPDALADPKFTNFERQQRSRARTRLGVPLLHAGEVIGVIFLARYAVRPFSGRQIDLVTTFADQAVIAIENTRLFEAEQASKRELTEALEQQTGASEVLSVISRSKFDLQPVFDTMAENAVRLCQAERAFIFRFDGILLRAAASYNVGQELRDFVDRNPIAPGRHSVSARAAVERRTVHVPDVQSDPEYAYAARDVDLIHTTLAVPLMRGNDLLGTITIYKLEVKPFTGKQIELVQTFADQAVIAIENTRLFEEVQARTHELAKTVEDLEIASQHKSQFVANMSHELRTPLAAILGYAELMQEGFYEPQGPKSLDALTRIRTNGKHLLGLINTVLDIAKIESGQFTLNMAEYAIDSVVETVRSATESLAENKKLALKTDVAASLPIGLGDEQRLTQVLLNLVGNAIKFTDRGEVRVTARTVNGHFAVSVMDTGPGIPEAEQMRIFEQFHQVDSSLTKAKGGTGLGLAIAKQIVEMHGGRIWVDSTVGKGSTFQMEIPTRAELRKSAP